MLDSELWHRNVQRSLQVAKPIQFTITTLLGNNTLV